MQKPEPLTRNGRVDLKVSHPAIDNKIIEFKGWWNSDKDEVVNQLIGYLTDFENDGYVFIINHTKNNITEKYKEKVISSEMKFIDASWEEVRFKDTGYLYYKSKHNFWDQVKTLYHFIFSVYC